MTRVPLNSSLVQAVSHDPETNTMAVELVNRGTYTAHDVPVEDFDAFVAAKSHGVHFNSVFKPAHGHKMKKIER